MLKIECPDCSEWVSLPFDIGIRETSCPKCSRTIPVKDVYVSAGPYTIHRDVLIRNMHRYKKLLNEAEKEFEDVGAEGGKADVTAASVKTFILHLKEMLSGCRESTRYPISEDITAKIKINDRVFRGKVLNISVSGLCLDAADSPVLILTDDLDIALSCGGKEITVSGRVAWSDKKGVHGIKFTGLSGKAREAIEAFITEKSVVARARK